MPTKPTENPHKEVDYLLHERSQTDLLTYWERSPAERKVNIVKLLPWFIGVVILFATRVAWAADADPNALTQTTDVVFDILGVVLPVVAVWLVHRAIAVWERRTKIDVPGAVEARIDEWVEKGIHLATEKSHQLADSKVSKLTGPEKLETAADFVFDLAQTRGWIDWSKDRIKAKIEAQLGAHR